MGKYKIFIIIFIVLTLAAAVLVFKPFSRQPAQTGQKPREETEIPAIEIPKTNPFEEVKTNPFKDIKTNPFE